MLVSVVDLNRELSWDCHADLLPALAYVPRVQVNGHPLMDREIALKHVKDHYERLARVNHDEVKRRAAKNQRTRLFQQRAQLYEARAERAAELLAQAPPPRAADDDTKPVFMPTPPAYRAQLTREDYMRAHAFTVIVNDSPTLTAQQKRTLIGQARHGDLEGAQKGYQKLTSVRPSKEGGEGNGHKKRKRKG